MLYYHVEYPTDLPKEKLDEYLANGWYRMQDFIFTTDLIVKGESLLPVFWLRHNVKHYQPTVRHLRVNKVNSQYSVSVAPLIITEELEELYQLYRQHINFDISPTLYDSLHGEEDNKIYHSQCISIRDGEQLIAAGIFDEGEIAIAGILNFYNPLYKQKSPGKFLMLQKMKWAAENNKQYYYTGYMSTAFSKFDYKAMLGNDCTEVYNRNERIWLPWKPLDFEQMEKWLFGSNNNSLVRNFLNSD